MEKGGYKLPEFNLANFKKENKDTKVKNFIEYLYEKLGDGTDDFDNEFFSALTVDDLVDSLLRYLSNNKITAQITGNNYLTSITGFFDMLKKDYQIKNDVFSYNELTQEFSMKCHEIISNLKESIPKDVASDEQYEKLNEGISSYMDSFNYDVILNEIDRIYDGNNEGKEMHATKYPVFMSILPIKLILKYALSNLTVVNLDISNLDMKNKTLAVNGLLLPLDKELIELFDTYINIRRYILEKYNLDEQKLFIKVNGTAYIKTSKHRMNIPDYGAFFRIMDKVINTQSAENFAKRRVAEFIEKGLDLFTIFKLTDLSSDSLINILEEAKSTEEMNVKVQHFFNEGTGIDKKYEIKLLNKKKPEYNIKCPFCNEYFMATSENWILVQYENSDKKYIACRKCKGENGKKI